MPNAVTPTGLTIKTRAEILDEMLNGTAGFPGLRDIYGQDIITDPNSPDGNLLNLLAQIGIDYEEFCQQVYASFDPDKAIGVSLDARCAINGIARKAGARTTQFVTVTVSQALTLNGVDTSTAPFSVSDSSGNRFQLVTTHAFGGSGSADLLFQSEKIGAILVGANTLTTIATPTLGVSSVTNGTLAGTLGTSEETDANLRLRRAQSVSLPSRGYLEGLIGALLSIEDVSDAQVFENNTNTTDANGIPGHSIWAIVDGGNDLEIARAIYVKRNAGCGMKGTTTVAVPQIDETTLDVSFDRPTAEDLWISFNITPISGSIDATYLRTKILEQLSYRIGQAADASAITALVKSLAPNGYIDSMGVSNTNSGYVAYKSPTGINYRWALASARILINGA